MHGRRLGTLTATSSCALHQRSIPRTSSRPFVDWHVTGRRTEKDCPEILSSLPWWPTPTEMKSHPPRPLRGYLPDRSSHSLRGSGDELGSGASTRDTQQTERPNATPSDRGLPSLRSGLPRFNDTFEACKVRTKVGCAITVGWQEQPQPPFHKPREFEHLE